MPPSSINGNTLINQEVMAVAKIKSWPPENMMTCFERRCLVAVAASADQGKPKLEIGTSEGYSTYCLAIAFPNSVIHTVDLQPDIPHKEQPGTFLGHHYKSSKCTNVVQHLISPDQNLPVLEMCDFVLIDGDHEISSVRKDFAQALYLIAPRGVIMLDDCFMNGPYQVIYESDLLFDWVHIKNTKLVYSRF